MTYLVEFISISRKLRDELSKVRYKSHNRSDNQFHLFSMAYNEIFWGNVRKIEILTENEFSKNIEEYLKYVA